MDSDPDMGYASEIGEAPYRKSSKNRPNKQFDNYDIKKR
jgi:hypothetical protein